jgi:hypothetical protein
MRIHGSGYIDRPPAAYSKLLNYFMMRTLEMDFSSRITADKLCQVLPVLESLVRHILLSGQDSMMGATVTEEK